LSPGQRAFCFVRQATEQGIALTTYGKSSGFCVDPIEKKPLYHFFPGTSVLSLGTAGCNLGCRYCQNWDISAARELDSLADSASPSKIATTAQIIGSGSVAFTYNDPIIFAEYAIDTAVECRELGIHPVAVTNGYITEQARGEFFGAMDAVNIDLKSFSEQFYRKLCFAHLDPVLDTIAYVANETDVWLELTNLVIPGHNDSSDEIEALSRWVRDTIGTKVPLHFSAFFPAYKMLDVPATPPEALSRARRIALDVGIEYVYTGNVDDATGGNTWCSGCGACLIERRGYAVVEYRIGGDGACHSCGMQVPGRFGKRAGTWGNRRLPVRMAPAA
jgi:pyruvate formate lyase activating enzyme